ncbi:hypothetical protein BGW36DRAFT_209571 [Talaromyces proteolyticus]|uniref:Zn(2)-C6 fungal-type domain-containing protein n=1 Tax=Talaromyces proteolyticus TaxID=1131652 RepID=A0AAD4KL79_9EURO|nr:uncharacterized protein BGW36DRAFT_209571 [Talaromyces proteolyticus]KAH8693711.1 hypothetical protein BGW36DRAFT_209571 [Talaromyces proteolyticus]
MADSQFLAPKPTKACVNCRRQKMKCQVDDAPPCRRCKSLKTECIFRPRANAAALHKLSETPLANATVAFSGFNFASAPSTNQASILSRLDTIEAILGIKKLSDDLLKFDVEEDLDIEPDEPDGDFPLSGVWKALTRLREIARPSQDSTIWSKKVVKQLWHSFHTHLPLLHFLADRKTFSSPTPLLLASILYISSLHHNSAEYANFSPGYFAATCSAIANLVMPSSSSFGLSNPNHPGSKVEEVVFNDILGLIMASLSSEAFIDSTGTWISIGYRLLLDHCPHREQGPQDWKGLFSGLQVIDVEHASIHLCYPLLPKQPPQLQLQNLDRSQDNAYRGLSQMMHSGISHFVGRGLPSIWSFVSGKGTVKLVSAETTFTDQDFQVIRRWAKELDEWLVRYNGASQPSEGDRHGILILLQYHLHKLFVLSIYHPARGYDLGAHNFTSMEKHELLISARSILRLRDNDTGIWSNWDLVMVTLAAMLVLRGIEDKMANQDDLNLVQSHLKSLQDCLTPTPSIQHLLAERLENALQNMQSPVSASSDLIMSNANVNFSWTLFDQNTLSLANPTWLMQDPLSMTPKHAVQPSPTEPRNGIPDQFHSDLVPGDAQAFQSRQWMQEQVSGMWPSTFHRLFGHDEAIQSENGALGS